jgi:hypothetical protein
MTGIQMLSSPQPVIIIPCPDCGQALGLRLLPDEPSAAECRHCTRPIDYAHRVRSGIPSGLIVRLMEWAKRSPKITGVRIGSGHRSDPDDDPFVHAWKSIREETRFLLAALGCQVETEAAVVAEVFDLRQPHEWTDQAIAARRRPEIRSQHLFDDGVLFGRRFVGRRDSPPPAPTSFPLRCPPGLGRVRNAVTSRRASSGVRGSAKESDSIFRGGREKSNFSKMSWGSARQKNRPAGLPRRAAGDERGP